MKKIISLLFVFIMMFSVSTVTYAYSVDDYRVDWDDIYEYDGDYDEGYEDGYENGYMDGVHESGGEIVYRTVEKSDSKWTIWIFVAIFVLYIVLPILFIDIISALKRIKMKKIKMFLDPDLAELLHNRADKADCGVEWYINSVLEKHLKKENEKK